MHAFEAQRHGQALRAWLLLALAALAAPLVTRLDAEVASPPGKAAPAGVAGIVVDLSGAPVAGAVVTLTVEGSRLEVRTGRDGRFGVSLPEGGTIGVTAEAQGFAPASASIAAGQREIRLLLAPAPFTEALTVTAVRGAAPFEGAAAGSVLSAAELLNAPAPTLDDVLRSTPGFSLFRRSSSRVSNPSTQAVTLRGISGTGASRTLVLVDGLPLNDPFGSWVYWNRVPQAAIERVEVVRGAVGDLYGADALGGAVQLLTLAPGPKHLRAIVDGGSHGTLRGSLFTSGRAGRFSGALAGEWLGTDGVFVMAPSERGLVDMRAQSDYRSGAATAAFDDGAWRARLRLGLFAEERNNGTRLVVNDTRWRQLSAEAAGPLARGHWTARFSGGRQRYFNNFSSVSADRSSERLTRAQEIPSEFATGSLEWARSWRAHVFLAGAEGRWTRASVQETRYSQTGEAVGPFLAGGDERTASVFARASLAVAHRVGVVLGARGDLWRSDPRGPGTPRHDLRFLSPRLSLSWQATRGLSVRASAARAYRTPTLNELHRGFRVGNVVTEGNPLLEPERLTSLEAGGLLSTRLLSARLTGFWSRLDDAISNVTLSTTPALITRQKQNTDRTRAAGVELELQSRPHPHLTLTAVAVSTDSAFERTPEQPTLQGKRIPQVARYQLVGTIGFADPRLATASAQVRVLGAQFDDDQNELQLPGFTVVDVYAGRDLARGLHVFAAVENLFDVTYDVARTPQRQMGWPRTVRVGLRLFRP